MAAQNAIEARELEMQAWYSAHRFKCRDYQQRFHNHLEKKLRSAGLMDVQLESRTKSVESFVVKATKTLPSQEFKYQDPRSEITDLVGARILVPLSTDIAPVATILKQNYSVDEESVRGEEEGHLDVPGYRSLHFLVRLNEADRMDFDFREFDDMTAEVQVRTTLQHAWAALQHDLMYKTDRAPTPAVRRRLVALAGLLELADRVFVAVRQAHSDVRDETVGSNISAGDKLTASALRHLAEHLFGEEDPAAQDWFAELKSITNDLGLETANHLYETLGAWRDRAQDVATLVRLRKPWVNSAYLLDLLLRLSMRQQYLDRRKPFDEDNPMDDEERQEFHTQFISELDSIESGLASS